MICLVFDVRHNVNRILSIAFMNSSSFYLLEKVNNSRGGSRAAATSKMERFVIIVNGFQSLTIITKRSICRLLLSVYYSILDVAAALDPPLNSNKL